MHLNLKKIVGKSDNKAFMRVNPYPAKVIYLNYQLLEVVSRYRDPQHQVVAKYSYRFNLMAQIYND